MSANYIIRGEGSERSIECLTCGRVSHHPKDVEELYCGNCHRFHPREIAPGMNLEPERAADRYTVFHKRIVGAAPIPNTHAHAVTLECGHQVMTFGSLDHAAGVILCTVCRGDV